MSENCEIDLSEHSEESGEDFSASEDDWVPDKKLRHETSSSDDSDDFEETSAGKAIARYIKLFILYFCMIPNCSFVQQKT